MRMPSSVENNFNPHSTVYQMAGDVRKQKSNKLPHSFLSGVKYQHLVAGLSGGVISTLATHPFDLIKLRFAGELTYCIRIASSL